jgi:hypothetical protein
MDLQRIKARHGVGAALAVGLGFVVVGEILVPVACNELQTQQAGQRWEAAVDRHAGAMAGARRVGDRLVDGDVEVLFLDDTLAIRALVVPDLRPAPPALVGVFGPGGEARVFEGGADLTYDPDTGRLLLIRLRPIRGTDLPRQVDDARDLARVWREQWLAELRAIVDGAAPWPRRHVYRPGKDPQSQLREIQKFLDEAR